MKPKLFWQILFFLFGLSVFVWGVGTHVRSATSSPRTVWLPKCVP